MQPSEWLCIELDFHYIACLGECRGAAWNPKFKMIVVSEVWWWFSYDQIRYYISFFAQVQTCLKNKHGRISFIDKLRTDRLGFNWETEVGITWFAYRAERAARSAVWEAGRSRFVFSAWILAELLVDRVSQELTTMPAKARRATVPSKIESHRPPVSILRVGQTQKRKRGGGGGKARAVPAAGDSGGGFVCRTAMRGATVRRRAASAVYPVVHIYYYSRYQQQPPHGIHHCHQACKQQAATLAAAVLT